MSLTALTLLLCTTALAQLSKTWQLPSADNYGSIKVTPSGHPMTYRTQPSRLSKYSPSGALLWTVSPPESSYLGKLSVDRQNNALVLSVSWPYSYKVTKYDPNGNEMWTAQHVEASDGFSSHMTGVGGMEIDQLGNAYVFTESYSYVFPTSRHYRVTKIGTDGTTLWSKRFGEPGNWDGHVRAANLAVDSSGNVYITGTGGSITRALTMKIDPQGELIWVRTKETYASTFEYCQVAVDSMDNLIAVHGFLTTKYDPDGNVLWEHTSSRRYNSLFIGRNNEVLVTFISPDFFGLYYTDYIVEKLSADGQLCWSAMYQHDPRDWPKDDAWGAVVMPNGDFVMVGNSYNEISDMDIAIVQFDGSTGQIKWLHRTDGPGHRWDGPGRVASDGQGAIYFSQYLGLTSQSGALSLVKWESNPDPDGDGLTNAQETALGTNPNDPDTDGDGLNDGAEVNTHHTNPLVGDTDGDGLLDGTEVDMAQGSGCPSPLDADSDDDGLSDGAEVALGTSPCNPDTDGDGVNDAQDPTPLTPGVPGSWIENQIRDTATEVAGMSLSLLDAPNANAAAGRRNALSTAFSTAANLIASGNRQAAIAELTALLGRLDGGSSPPDWMVDGAEKTDLYTEVQLMIYLLGLP